MLPITVTGSAASFSIPGNNFEVLAFDIGNSPYAYSHIESGVVLFSFLQQNIFFTLALGCISVYTYKTVKDRTRYAVLPILSTIPFLIISALARTDYMMWGVLAVLAAYIFDERKKQILSLFIVLTVFYLGYASWNGRTFGWLQGGYSYVVTWLFSCLSLVLIYFYNGKRGRNSKWFFYIYYSLHLVALAAIRNLLLGAVHL